MQVFCTKDIIFLSTLVQAWFFFYALMILENHKSYTYSNDPIFRLTHVKLTQARQTAWAVLNRLESHN
jgi:hypothetical protein